MREECGVTDCAKRGEYERHDDQPSEGRFTHRLTAKIFKGSILVAYCGGLVTSRGRGHSKPALGGLYEALSNLSPTAN